MQGCDVITCHVDGPKVVLETAAGRGCYVCGYHADQTALAPEKYLTGAEWNWAKVYTGMVTDGARRRDHRQLRARRPGRRLHQDVAARPRRVGAARNQFEATKAEILKGGYSVIKGPLNDNAGNVLVTGGQALRGDRHRARKHGLSRRRRLGSTS
jgi:basic membrane protein A and related proteins